MDRLPNIVLVTADHLRFDSLGCSGNTVIRTPGIDSLASQGTSFTRFFVQEQVPLRTGFFFEHEGTKLSEEGFVP